MTKVDEDKMKEPFGVMLRDACPQVVAKLADHFNNSGDQDLTRQLNEALVVSQVLNGTPEGFSFMAYPVPRLTFEQRQSMVLQETRAIDVPLPDVRIRIDLDDFGKINWFHVTNYPEMYASLGRFMPTEKVK